MIKKIFITSLLLYLLSVSTSANNCFQYVELPKGTKKAIEDYIEHYGNSSLATTLYLVYQSNSSDSVVFTLVACSMPVFGFTRNPTPYFSLHNDKLILLYNGEESDYNPDAADMNNIVYFLSHFDKYEKVIKSDWEKKELTVCGGIFYSYSPWIVQYSVDNEKVIRSQIGGENSPGYPKERYNVRTIYVKSDNEELFPLRSP